MNSDNTVIKVWEHNHNINYENDNDDKIVYIIMEIIICQRFSEIVIAQILWEVSAGGDNTLWKVVKRLWEAAAYLWGILAVWEL